VQIGPQPQAVAQACDAPAPGAVTGMGVGGVEDMLAKEIFDVLLAPSRDADA
jgi:hypothetical protein